MRRFGMHPPIPAPGQEDRPGGCAPAGLSSRAARPAPLPCPSMVPV